MENQNMYKLVYKLKEEIESFDKFVIDMEVITRDLLELNTDNVKAQDYIFPRAEVAIIKEVMSIVNKFQVGVSASEYEVEGLISRIKQHKEYITQKYSGIEGNIKLLEKLTTYNTALKDKLSQEFEKVNSAISERKGKLNKSIAKENHVLKLIKELKLKNMEKQYKFQEKRLKQVLTHKNHLLWYLERHQLEAMKLEGRLFQIEKELSRAEDKLKQLKQA